MGDWKGCTVVVKGADDAIFWELAGEVIGIEIQRKPVISGTEKAKLLNLLPQAECVCCAVVAASGRSEVARKRRARWNLVDRRLRLPTHAAPSPVAAGKQRPPSNQTRAHAVSRTRTCALVILPAPG